MTSSLLSPVALRFGSYQPKDKQPHKGYVSSHADNPEEDIWGDAHEFDALGVSACRKIPARWDKPLTSEILSTASGFPPSGSVTAGATAQCGLSIVAPASSPTEVRNAG